MGSEDILRRIDLKEVLQTVAAGNNGFSAFQTNHDFSDAPYTFYRNMRFYIEVLVWNQGTTSIHSHAFSGAFGVISGDSISVTYRFDERARINARFRIGRLNVLTCEHLEANAVRPIHAGGDGLIHSVYHVARPSATLVARTHTDSDRKPQFNYHVPGIAFEQDFVDIVAKRQCQALNILLQTNFAEGEDAAMRALEEASPDTRYWIVNGINYTDLPRQFLSRIKTFLAITEFGTEIWTSLVTSRRLNQVRNLRTRIKPAHLRRFHAAVLNIPDRKYLVKYLIEKHGEDGCRNDVAMYMKELSAEGILKWPDSEEALTETVCGCLFDDSNEARLRLRKSGDPLLNCLAR